MLTNSIWLRQLAFTACVLIPLIAWQSVLASTQSAGDAEIVVYTASDIVTMDAAQPSATAVAVEGGRIVQVGSTQSIIAALDEQSVRIDNRFANHVIVPGLIEPHIHPILSALTLTSHIISIEPWDLPDKTFPAASDQVTYIAMLRAAEASLTGTDQPLVSWGYHHYFHGELDKTVLDSISRTRPIIIWHRSAHEFIMNSAALVKLGINSDALKQHSEFVRKQIDLDKGHFWEAGAFDFLLPYLMPLLAPQIAPGVALMENYLHAAGVTTAAEPGGLPLFYKQQMQILTDEGSPLRFYYIPDGRSLAKKFQGRALLDATEKALLPPEGNVRFLPGHVKLFSDGAMFSQLMQMETGYLDGHQGEWLMEKSIFEQAFRTYWDEGYQIHIHQNGDKGLQRIIDVLSDNLARNPRQDHRTTIVHFGFSSSQQVKALADLGAIVSANPYYTIALAETYSRVGIGPKRAATMVRLGEVVKQGITVSLHSDMPMAPGKPLFLMWAAVNRMTDSGRVYAASQALTPMQALRAVTLDAAYTLRLEDELGSISTGKRADFTILEQHPLEIAKTKIKDIGVAATVVEGKVYAIKK